MSSRVAHAASCVSFFSLVACNDSIGEQADTDGTTHAEHDTTETDTGAEPSTTGVETTGIDTGNQPTTNDTTESTSTSESIGSSSNTATDTSDDTTTGEVVPDGPWCGYVGTGPRELEGAGTFLPLSVHHGGPIALPLWSYDNGAGLRAAIYDLATATWGDTVTLDDSAEVDIGGYPTGAVDTEGNAIVVTGDNLADPSVRAHRYDAATTSWTTSILPGVFTTIRAVSVTVDADGDAIVIAQNELEYGVSTFVQWFYDVATDTWSAPEEIGPIESYSPSVALAQERETGDAVFLMDVTGDLVQLCHRTAATGDWIVQDVDAAGQSYLSPAGVTSLGDGRFVAVTDSGDFGVDNGQLTAYVFEDGAWQPGFVLDEGIELSDVRVSTDRNGRMIVAWDAHPTSIRARTYDASSGWSPLHVVNAGQEGEDYIVEILPTLDEDGYVVAWSQYNDDSLRTYVRRLDDDGWSPIVDVDPDQPALSDISALHAIASDHTRVVWARDTGNANFTGWFYACHEPDGEWTEPVEIDLDYPRFEKHASGEFLVVGYGDDALVAEYFAAQ